MLLEKFDLTASIDGFSVNPFHFGENATCPQYV
jgi:hypothetical protein